MYYFVVVIFIEFKARNQVITDVFVHAYMQLIGKIIFVFKYC